MVLKPIATYLGVRGHRGGAPAAAEGVQIAEERFSVPGSPHNSGYTGALC